MTDISVVYRGYCAVAGNGGGAVILSQSGIIQSLVHVGTGFYEVTLSEPLEPNEAIVDVQGRNGSQRALSVSFTGNTQININSEQTGGFPSNYGFTLMVGKVRGPW